MKNYPKVNYTSIQKMDISIAENIKDLGEIRRQEKYRHTHIKQNIWHNRKISVLLLFAASATDE